MYKQSINEDSDNLETIPEYRQWHISTGRPFLLIETLVCAFDSMVLNIRFASMSDAVVRLPNSLRRCVELTTVFEIAGNVQLGLACFRFKASYTLNEHSLKMNFNTQKHIFLSCPRQHWNFPNSCARRVEIHHPEIGYSWEQIQVFTIKLCSYQTLN